MMNLKFFLQERACELVDSTNGDIKRKVSEKVQELHSTMFRNMASAPSVNPYAATYRPNTSTGTLNPNENTSRISCVPSIWRQYRMNGTDTVPKLIQ